MIATATEVLDYIPQRTPFVMIDKLVEVDEIKSVSGFHILPENILCSNGYFSESGLIENIAQTAAAGVGYTCKKNNTPVPIGYIASIKDLTIIQLPPINAAIITEVLVTNQVLNISVVKGTVTCLGEIIAQCEMRIFIKE